MYRKATTVLRGVKLPEMSVRLTAFQCVCAFFTLYGVSYWSVPIALVIGGVAGILVAERQQTQPKREAQFADQARDLRDTCIRAKGLGNSTVQIDAVIAALNEG
jgi:hypothetical protein